jgi:putative flavoprotein involved in K+ transport
VGGGADDSAEALDVANVVWCTGYRENFEWMDKSLLGDDGRPSQRRGISTSAPGLFFLGQEFLYAATSATLPGACRDAQYLAAHLPAPVPAQAPVPMSNDSARSIRQSRRPSDVR